MMRLRRVLGLAAFLQLWITSCTSGTDQNVRNIDYFSEASRLTYPTFTTTPYGFNGNIQALVADINALGVNTEQTYAGTNATIEGIVTIPSDYGIAIGTSSGGCATSDFIFARSFVLQDANAGILVAYGQEPPTEDVAQANSAKYINNARFGNTANYGDRVRLTVTKVQKYGSGANVNAIITDFSVSSLKVISSKNSIAYTVPTAAFTRASDLYQVRRLEGYVITPASYAECPSASNTRQFQFNYQTGYVGATFCVGTLISCTTPTSCTCSGTTYSFQLSYNLGAGTLTGFDTSDSFSYNLKFKAKVRMTGPIFPPQYNQADSGLKLMLDQKVQVESIQ